MKKTLFLSMVMLAILAMGVYARGGTQQIRMATGGNTGTYYAYGSAVGQILTEKTKFPITIQSTGASKANIQLIAAGEVELAIVQNDVMDYAYQGTELFNGEQTTAFSAMAGLYAEVCQIIANPASGIRTVADLRGKNVSVGDAGSGVEFNARQILEAYGISFNDIGKQNLSFGASADALRDNKIDAFFCTAGAPTTAVVDLAIGKDIILLEIDDDHMAQLIQKYPFYTRFPVPAGSYRGVTQDVKTVAVKATFIVSKTLSDDVVYQLTKTLFESRDEIISAHAKGTELSPAYGVGGISIPFHPGAAKYFKEIGALQ
jgi:TRAP transporter TAXI family solute receptor